MTRHSDPTHDVCEIVDDIQRCLEPAASVEPATARAEAGALNRAGRWLEAQGLSLNLLRQQTTVDQFGQPEFPAAVVVLYRLSLNRLKPSSAQTEINTLKGALGRNGWSTASFEHLNGVGGPLARLKLLHESEFEDAGKTTEPMRAKPLDIRTDVVALLDTVDELADVPGVEPAWIDQWRDLIVIWWWLAARLQEATVRLHWSWIDGLDDATVVTFPPGLKGSVTEAQIVLIATRDPRIDPVAALRRRRDALRALGAPCSGDHRVFIDIRPYQAGRNGPSVPQMLRKYRGRIWVDYAADLVADTDWCPDLSDAARQSRADGMAAKTFANSYNLLCRLAGIEPGDTTERLTSHGPRRGLASALAEAGASEEDIARALRHRSPTSQQSYISEAIAPPRDLRSLVPDHLGPRPEPPPPSPAPAQGARHTCGVEVRSPHGDHEPCGRTVAGRRADTPLCKRHLRCFDEHGGFTDRMSDPVDIKKNGWTCECDIVDSNGQQVGKCARPAVGCHDGLVLCTGHYARASKGWTGNRLRAPLGPDRGGGRPRKQ